MRLSPPEHSTPDKWVSSAPILFVIVLVSTVFLMFWNAWSPYSFWLDEVFSVSAAREGFTDLFKRWILIDVHPPLYSLLLKVWVDLFGFSESATRSLSVLAGIAVVVLAVNLVRSGKEWIVYATMLLALPWFVYFSQEVRPYVFLYLLGLAATLAVIRGQHVFLLLILVVMAWLHYFGLFFGLSLLFARVVVRKRINKHEVLALSLMLAWLPLHLVFGEVLDKATGGFWIRVSGPDETLANFFGAISPGFYVLWRAVPFVSVIYAILMLSVLCFFPYQALKNKSHDGSVAQLALGVLFFASGVLIIDHVVPMSTSRNFLVAMPAFFYVIYRLGIHLLSKKNIMILLLIWTGIQIPSAYVLMQYKHSEFENYRAATAEVIRQMDAGRRAYYLNKCQGNQGYNSDALNNLYMNALDPASRLLPILCLKDIKPEARGLVFLACLQEPVDVLRKIMPSGYIVKPMDSKGLCSVISSAN